MLFDFLDRLHLIFKTISIEISLKMFNSIWEKIKNSKDFLEFHKYSSVLTSGAIYKSFRTFGRAFAPKIKLIVTQLTKDFQALYGNNSEGYVSTLKINEIYNELNEEKKLIIKFHIVRLCQMFKKEKSSLTEE